MSGNAVLDACPKCMRLLMSVGCGILDQGILCIMRRFRVGPVETHSGESHAHQRHFACCRVRSIRNDYGFRRQEGSGRSRHHGAKSKRDVLGGCIAPLGDHAGTQPSYEVEEKEIRLIPARSSTRASAAILREERGLRRGFLSRLWQSIQLAAAPFAAFGVSSVAVKSCSNARLIVISRVGETILAPNRSVT